MKSLLIVLIMSGLLWLVPSVSVAQVYNFGKSETVILGLGRDGTLVGQLDLFTGFIKRPEQPIEKVQYPGSIATGIVAIDERCILGAFTSTFFDVVGFRECKGESTILYQFGFTFPTAMHCDGTVVGYYSPTGGRTWSGFIQKGTDAMQPFNVPGASSTRIFAIDERGRIAGDFNDDKGEHGFVWDGKSLMVVDIKHAVGTAVTGLNSRCILGAFNLNNGNQEGFVRCPDNSKDDIPILVGDSAFPRALLPDGTIGGFFYDNSRGGNSGFVLRRFAP